MTFQLVFTYRKGHDVQISCPSLGSQYSVSMSHYNGAVTVTRTAPVPTHIATFKLKHFSKSWIMFQGQEKKPLNTFLKSGVLSRYVKARCTLLSILVAQTSISISWYVFKGQDGEEYRWRLREDGPALFKENIPIVTYYRKYKNEDKEYLEVYDSSLQNTLDHIILTFAIMERL
ncbi:hypothetical protein FRC15_011124 [Serendipita sp. 397]|nr:hypothetical protein FRC15_011124 [Serendipita sp. 397]